MITIAIPVFNRTVYLRKALERCLTQTLKDVEVLVSDSSSHQGPSEIIRSFKSPKLKYVRHPSSITLTQKLNFTLQEAKGRFMVILCDDDLLDTDYCRTMYELTRKYPEASLFKCRSQIIDHEGRLLRLDNRSKPYVSPAEFLTRVFLKEKYFFKMNITGLLFPRELFIRLGGFYDLPVPWHTDRIAWATLAAQGGCAFENRPLCSIRLHPASLTSAFQSNHSISIESDLQAKMVFENLIADVEKRASGREKKKELLQARANLDAYTRRHLTRSLDHGFLAALEENGNRPKSFQRLFEQMTALEVPVFNSARLYYCLAKVPPPLRSPLLGALKRYKVEKWCA